MYSGLAGPHLLIILLTWAFFAAVIGAVAYVVIRLAVLHALKAHTRWLRSDGAGPAAAPPAGPEES